MNRAKLMQHIRNQQARLRDDMDFRFDLFNLGLCVALFIAIFKLYMGY